MSVDLLSYKLPPKQYSIFNKNGIILGFLTRGVRKEFYCPASEIAFGRETLWHIKAQSFELLELFSYKTNRTKLRSIGIFTFLSFARVAEVFVYVSVVN